MSRVQSSFIMRFKPLCLRRHKVSYSVPLNLRFSTVWLVFGSIIVPETPRETRLVHFCEVHKTCQQHHNIGVPDNCHKLEYVEN